MHRFWRLGSRNVRRRSDMTSAAQVVLAEGPKLAPFLKAVAVYFVLLLERPGWQAALIKVLPVLALVFYVLLHGCGSQRRRASLMLGLLLSAGGDVLLVWPTLFLPGMAFFGAAHAAYIIAFGFTPLAPRLAATLFAVAAVVVAALLPGLEGPLVVAVPAYCAVLATMAWRAVAGASDAGLPARAGATGAALFAISDALIGIHCFLTPVPYSQTLIMSTYYAAQLGIALSVLDLKEVNNANQQGRLDVVKDRKPAEELSTLPCQSLQQR